MEVIRFHKYSKFIYIALAVGGAIFLLSINHQKPRSPPEFDSQDADSKVIWASDSEHDEAVLSNILSGKDTKLSQTNSRLLEYIKNNILIPPSEEPYKLTRDDDDPSVGQSRYVRELLNNMKNGFFIEAGAVDGELFSNTLYLERFLNWTGLLVEGNPSLFRSLVTKHRKAWLGNCCLSTKPYPQKVNFSFIEDVPVIGGILEDNDYHTDNREKTVKTVQCLPLSSLLAALDIDIVDYFSLDVEGSELGILHTIPFDKVIFKVMTIEYNHLAGMNTTGLDEYTKLTNAAQTLIEYLVPKGYSLVGISPSSVSKHHDAVFVHNSVYKPDILESHLARNKD